MPKDGATGRGFPKAEYKRQRVPAHRGNKFIEALPEVMDDEQVMRALRRRIVVADEERAEPAHIRRLMVYAVPGGFLQPLIDHVLLAHEFAAIIRTGYLTRNPESPHFLRELGRDLEEAASDPPRRSGVAGLGVAVIGMSGVGKSTAVDEVLELYPQVIHHPALTGTIRTTLQVVWLVLSCPPDGSLKTLYASFFSALDELLHTNYHHLHARSGTEGSMRDAMRTLCRIHGIGVLVIDEIQTLRRAKTVYAEHPLLRNLLTLRDVLKVPVVVVGTEAAEGVLQGALQVSRRHAGVPTFDRMRSFEVFDLFCGSLFAAYYLREPLDTSEAFKRKLHYLSLGITDIVIKLFVAAQMRALTMGIESIDGDLLQAVYDDCFKLLHPFFAAMREEVVWDEVGFEEALKKTDMKAIAKAASEPGSVPPRRAPAAPSRAVHPPSGASSPRPRQKAEVAGSSTASQLLGGLLPGILAGRADGETAHAAFLRAGIVRDLATEAGVSG